MSEADKMHDRVRKRVRAAMHAVGELPPLPPIPRVPIAAPVKAGVVQHKATETGDYVGQLERLTSKALNTIEEVLDYDGIPSPDDLKLLQIKQTAASTVLNTQLKVDDNSLKKRQVDLLPQILEVMRVQAAKLPEMKMVEHSR